MSDEQQYTIQGLDEYIRQGEPQKRERSEAWKVAIGLQQVDRLQTSEYLLDTAKRHIEGDISINEAKQLIDSYYKSASGRKVVENDRTEEADKVAARITELIDEKTFSFTPAQLISIHRRLFDGIYKLAGGIAVERNQVVHPFHQRMPDRLRLRLRMQSVREQRNPLYNGIQELTKSPICARPCARCPTTCSPPRSKTLWRI